MTLVQKAGIISKNERTVEIFLDIYKKSAKKTLIQLDAMRNINRLFDYIPYQSIIEPLYLEALQESNYNYRVAAIRGLRYSDDQKLKDSLKKYQNDPSKDVRFEADRIDTDPREKFDIDQLKNLLKIAKKRKKDGLMTKDQEKAFRRTEWAFKTIIWKNRIKKFFS